METVPFSERMTRISRWESSQDIAYQIAWAYMRGELRHDESWDKGVVYPHLSGMRLDNVNRMVDLIREASCKPFSLDEVRYQNLAQNLDESLPLLTERHMVLMVRAVYRHDFIRNPDLEKDGWWDFVERLHETLDPEGRTSRRGLGFKARDWTPEAARISMLLNRVFAKADRLWDYGTAEEGSYLWNTILADPSPEELLDHVTMLAAARAGTSDLKLLTDEGLVDLLWKTKDACAHCKALTFSVIDAKRLAKAVETVEAREADILREEMALDEMERREYECD
jgi:hypothetical protein